MNMRIGRRAVVLALLLALPTACDSPRVESTSAPTALRLDRPDRVIVSPFTALAQDVRPDAGVESRVTRAIENEPLSQAELRDARAAQTALQQAMVSHLRAQGLPAEAGEPESAQGNALLVQGQIVALNEGNRTRRTLIGFGAGRASMTAEVQLLYVAGAAAPQFLESFEAEAATPRRPGLAMPAMSGRDAAVAASAGLQGASELQRAEAGGEVARVAEAMATRIATFARSQGWIPPAR